MRIRIPFPSHARRPSEEPGPAPAAHRGFTGTARMIGLITAIVLALGFAAHAATRNTANPAAGAPVTVPLGDIVATKDSVYGLAANHAGVYEWSGLGTEWIQIHGPADTIYATADTLYATDKGNGDIWQYQPVLGRADQFGKWTRIGGPSAGLAATDDHLYAVSPDHSGVYEYTAPQRPAGLLGDVKPAHWDQVRTKGTAQVYANRDTLYATDNTTGDIWQYNPNPTHKSSGGELHAAGVDGPWTRIGGPGATFTATDDHLYAVSPDHSGVYEYTAPQRPAGLLGDVKPAHWDQVRTKGTAQVYANRDTLYATDNTTGDIWQYNPNPTHKSSGGELHAAGVDGPWTRIGGPGATFTTGGKNLYGLSPDRKAVYRYTGSGSTWTGLGAPVGSPASDQDKRKRLDELTQPGDTARNAWNKARNAHQNNNWDRFGFNWDTDYCSQPAPDQYPIGWDFRLACARHDFGYHNFRDLLGLGDLTDTDLGKAYKKRVDDLFHDDLKHACAVSDHDPIGITQSACDTVAETYYKAVQHLGTDKQKERFTQTWHNPLSWL